LNDPPSSNPGGLGEMCTRDFSSMRTDLSGGGGFRGAGRRWWAFGEMST